MPSSSFFQDIKESLIFFSDVIFKKATYYDNFYYKGGFMRLPLSEHFKTIVLQEAHNNSLYNTLHKACYVINQKLMISDFEVFCIDFCVNFLFFFWAVLVIVIFYAFCGVCLTNQDDNSVEYFSDMYDGLSDVDDEFGAIDDALHYAPVFALVAAWYFCFTFFYMFFFETMIWVFIMFELTLSFILLLPITVLYSFGWPFFVIIRGISRTPYWAAEVFYDCLALMSMVARYIIQHVRILVIFLAYLEFFELVYFNLNLTGTNFFAQFFSFKSSNSALFLNNYWYDWFFDLCMSHLFLAYYCGHLSYSFANQFLTFLGLTLVLFFFLYTHFDDIVFENYFKIKLAK